MWVFIFFQKFIPVSDSLHLLLDQLLTPICKMNKTYLFFFFNNSLCERFMTTVFPLSQNFDVKVIKWAFGFWYIDEKVLFLTVLVGTAEEIVRLVCGWVSFFTNHFQEVSCSLFQWLASARVGIVATEIKCALPNAWAQALWLCSVAGAAVSKAWVWTLPPLPSRPLYLHLWDWACSYASDISPQCTSFFSITECKWGIF